MANKVTGSTDITGAISVAPKVAKCVLLIGKAVGTPSDPAVADTIFTIGGTADVKGKFGDGSDLVKMTKILISNGVTYIKGMVVGTTGTTDAEKYETSLAASLLEKDVKCILLDTNDATVVVKLKGHLAIAEGEDMFRYAVIAPTKSTVSQTDLTTLSATIDSNRIFIPGPAFLDDAGVLLDAQFAQAGLTSAIMTETDDPALPLNGVHIYGFGGVSRAMLESEMQILVSKGITPIYSEGGIPTIYRLVTSDQDVGLVWQEGTTRFIADHVLETVENTLRANFKRTKNVARILDAIKTSVKTVLETLNGLEIIENFDATTLSVIKDPTDLYGALVDYEFDVVTPLYTITINQHMKL
jgi:phage tail sheath gpL-like